MRFRPLIAISLFSIFGQGGAFAFTVKTAPDGKLIQWPQEDSAIFYEVSSRGYGSRAEAVGALDQAFVGWEKRSRGNLRFIFHGQSEGREAEKDGSNTLVWVEDEWSYPPEVVAMSTTWYSPATGLIEEVDIEFNARDYQWSIDGSGEVMDIQAVAMHEIGHLLGIDHSFNPAAVMNDSLTPTRPVKKALSQDDLEALWFLYPVRKHRFFLYDLPVLFYPEDFPREAAFKFLPVPGERVLPGMVSLSSIDVNADSFRSELVGVCLNQDGGYFLEVKELTSSREGGLELITSRQPIELEGNVTGIAGIDIDRDGILGEVAVLERTGRGEKILFYDVSADSSAPPEQLASWVIAGPPANNILSMAALDAGGDGIKSELIILRAVRGGFSLYLHTFPPLDDDSPHRQKGIELRLPGFRKGSKLLGLAVLDTEGYGDIEDLVVLEKTLSDELWLHAFRLTAGAEGASFDIRYLTSVIAPAAEGNVMPLQMTGLDSNRDGFFDELVVLFEEE